MVLAMTYFTHDIDDDVKFCRNCGRFLADLQRKTVWIDSEPHPKCEPGLIAVSHLVRRKGEA